MAPRASSRPCLQERPIPRSVLEWHRGARARAHAPRLVEVIPRTLEHPAIVEHRAVANGYADPVHLRHEAPRDLGIVRAKRIHLLACGNHAPVQIADTRLPRER